ncbi:MAG: hypothetical protein KGI29_05495 [Pseudomonadota bacterium]|nr:hypothetical protein [Pseudomonadota bacterium]MDE3037779.1 hypothetical protein [Pseudomonadota bacterium]
MTKTGASILFPDAVSIVGRIVAAKIQLFDYKRFSVDSTCTYMVSIQAESRLLRLGDSLLFHVTPPVLSADPSGRRTFLIKTIHFNTPCHGSRQSIGLGADGARQH